VALEIIVGIFAMIGVIALIAGGLLVAAINYAEDN